MARGCSGFWVMSTFWMDGYREDLVSVSLGYPFLLCPLPCGFHVIGKFQKKKIYRLGGREVEISDGTRCMLLTKEDFVPRS